MQPQQQLNEDMGGGPYAVYRQFTTFGEHSIDNMMAYFHERIEIEAQYAASLERLAKKTFPPLPEGGPVRSSSEAWRRINQSTLALASAHQKLVFNIDWVLDSLNKAQERQREHLKILRAEVKTMLREWHDLRTISIPKLRLAYLKKCEAYEIELKASGASSPKTVKAAKELQAADHGYRMGVQRLEEHRLKLIKIRERANSLGALAEQDRIESVRTALTKYGEIENKVSQSRQDETNAMSLFVECIKPEVDLATYAAEFISAWPDPVKTCYENYKVKTPIPDLIFGVSLDTVMKRHSGESIPPLVEICIGVLEQRGLEVEGIHRINGRANDVEVLRLQLELDLSTIDWSKFEPHTISTVLKAYFKELPEPLFLFPLKDRVEYSLISDEKDRLYKLKSRIIGLPKLNRILLKRVIAHLTKVLENGAANKVTIQALSVVFGPILFQSQLDPTEAASGGALGWFSKSSTPAATSEAQQMEQLRLDVDQLFNGAASSPQQQQISSAEHQSVTASVATDLFDKASIVPVIDLALDSASVEQVASSVPAPLVSAASNISNAATSSPTVKPALPARKESTSYITDSVSSGAANIAAPSATIVSRKETIPKTVHEALPVETSFASSAPATVLAGTISDDEFSGFQEAPSQQVVTAELAVLSGNPSALDENPGW